MSAVEDALADLTRRVEELEERERGQEWFTAVEAAAYLRVSLSTMKRLVKDGEVRTSFVGGRRIIRRGWLDEHAATREHVAPTTAPRRRRSLPYVVPTTDEGAKYAS